MYRSYLNDLDNSVFAQTVNGDLIGIKTNKYNDVFTQHDLGRGMTDIINSVENGVRQYRLAECNFYLCENC